MIGMRIERNEVDRSDLWALDIADHLSSQFLVFKTAIPELNDLAGNVGLEIPLSDTNPPGQRRRTRFVRRRSPGCDYPETLPVPSDRFRIYQPLRSVSSGRFRRPRDRSWEGDTNAPISTAIRINALQSTLHVQVSPKSTMTTKRHRPARRQNQRDLLSGDQC